MGVLDLPTGRGAGRVAFKAIEDDVRARVAAGWTLRAIYRRHRDDLAISYGQFRCYVRQFVEAARPRRQKGEVALAPRTSRAPPPARPELERPGAPDAAASGCAAAADAAAEREVAPAAKMTMTPADVDRFAAQPVDLDGLARHYRKIKKP